MFSKLAELFVEFTVTGIEAVQKSLTAVQTQLETVRASVDAVGSVAAKAMAVAAAAITGFAVAGLHASAMGEILSFQMGLLSRTIAGLFGPEIKKAIDLVRQLTTFIQSLSDAQKANIAKWIEGSLAALTVLTILPKLVGAIQGVVAALVELTAAETFASAGLNLIIPVLEAIIAGLAAFFVATDTGRDMLGKLADAFQPLLKVGQELFAQLSPVLDMLAEAFGRLAQVVVNLFTASLPSAEAMRSILSGLGAFVAGIANQLAFFGNVLATVFKAIAPIIDLLNSVLVLVLRVAGVIGALFTATILAPVQLLFGLLGGVLKLFQPFIDLVMQIADAFGEVLDAVQELFAALEDVFSELVSAIAELFEPLKDIFTEFVQALVSVIVPLIKSIAAAIREAAAEIRSLLGLPAPKKAEPGNRGTLAPPVGGPEDIAARFARAQASALKSVTGKTPAEKTEEHTRDSANLLRKLLELLGGKPDVIKGLIGG